jgi:7-carboxy-7-deazaguanine synthase
MGHVSPQHAFLYEIFSSIQGEGIRLGERQTFVRFRGCNLSCQYCDTVDARSTDGDCACEGRTLKNPVSITDAARCVTDEWVSVTGGEPLLQPEFLQNLCVLLKAQGRKIYLETNGTLPDALEAVIQSVDTVALDFKIPSATGGEELWDAHEQCLQIAVQRDVFVKAIIDEHVEQQEIDRACTIVSSVNKDIPLVIQPVFGKHIPQLLDIQKHCLKTLRDVRIIPQIHKMLGLR